MTDIHQTTDNADKFRKTIDRRLLILYGLLVLIVLLVVLFFNWSLNKVETNRRVFENAIVVNCQANQKNTQAFNALLDRLVEAVNQNKTYTDAERKKAIEFYETGRQEIPTCPPVSDDRE